MTRKKIGEIESENKSALASRFNHTAWNLLLKYNEEMYLKHKDEFQLSTERLAYTVVQCRRSFTFVPTIFTVMLASERAELAASLA